MIVFAEPTDAVTGRYFGLPGFNVNPVGPAGDPWRSRVLPIESGRVVMEFPSTRFATVICGDFSTCRSCIARSWTTGRSLTDRSFRRR